MPVHAETAGKKLDARLDCPTCRRPWSQHTTRESRSCRARARGASIEEVLAMRVTPIRPTGAPPAAEMPERPVERPRGAPAPFAEAAARAARAPDPPVPGYNFQVAPGPAEAAAATRTQTVPIDAAQLGLDPAAVRAWARTAGFAVVGYGRLSRKVIEAYTAAHNLAAPPGGSTLETARAAARDLQRFTIRQLADAAGLNLHTARDRVAQLDAVYHEVVRDGRGAAGALRFRWHDAEPAPPAPPERPEERPEEAPAPSPPPVGPADACEALRSILGVLASIEPFASDPEVARFLAAGDARLAELAASRLL